MNTSTLIAPPAIVRRDQFHPLPALGIVDRDAIARADPDQDCPVALHLVAFPAGGGQG